MADDSKLTTAPETVAEVLLPQVKPDPAPAKASKVDPAKVNPDIIPGFPKIRFHPVFGRKEFSDPLEYFRVVGPNDKVGDWRFETAAEADAARTDTEAQVIMHKNLTAKVSRHEDADATVIQNSVQATEAAKAGAPEPGLEALDKSASN